MTGAAVARGKWIHADTYCPKKPRTGLHVGRHYRCSCGRIWQVVSVAGDKHAEPYVNVDWELVQGTPLTPLQWPELEYVGEPAQGRWFWDTVSG